jgi:biotin carboxyl carrier protein
MSLSYGDVRAVLALIDGHTQGTAHFVDGDLSVTVRARQPGAARVVRSPAVGRLRIPAEAIALGGRVEAGTVLATVHSAGRDTPVKAEVGGNLETLCAEDGDFVEYGQALAIISGAEAS